MCLSLNLRRQIFIAVCDDLLLRDRLAAQIQAEISKSSPVGSSQTTAPIRTASGKAPRTPPQQTYPRLVSLHLNLNDPNPIVQMAQWLTQFPPPKSKGQQASMPAFQILGIEQLTRQSAVNQRLFFTHLQGIERNLPLLESSLLIWVNQPWFHALPQSAPEFWRCRTGIFEFMGDPTPLSITSPERISVPPLRQTVQTAIAPQPAIAAKTEAPHARAADSAAKLDPLPHSEVEPAAAQLDESNEIAAQLETAAIAENSWDALLQELTQPDETDLAARQRSLQKDSPDVSVAQPEPEPGSAAAASEIVESAAEAIAPSPISLPPELQQAHLQNLPEIQQIELLHQQQAPPEVLASAYRSLGNLFRDRIEQGEASPENLVTAIQSYEQALLRLSDSSNQWTDVLNDLGNLYWMLSRALPELSEALSCLELGIQAYQLALTKVNLQTQAHTYPHTYSMVQNNLGAAYADLARYQDPAPNLQRSAQAYQEALRYRKAETDPLRYASTQNNLGTTYWNLAQHQQAESNLKQAIASYSEALHYYEPEQEPINYAMIQNNLGTAYWNLAQYERPQDWLMLSVSAYRTALKYRTLEAAPVAFAATQNNLGTAYWHLANHTSSTVDRLSYLRQAIATYEITLQAAKAVTKRNSANAAQSLFNFDLFATHNNLGLAHHQIATDLQSGLDSETQSAHLESALKHHVIALQGWEQNAELRQTAINCVVQTMRAFYSQLGLPGQTFALSIVPGQLLPEILPKL